MSVQHGDVFLRTARVRRFKTLVRGQVVLKIKSPKYTDSLTMLKLRKTLVTWIFQDTSVYKR